MKVRAVPSRLPFLVTSVYVTLIFLQLSKAHLLSTRWKRQSSCKEGKEFHCKSGECISEFLLCDGEPNCKDGSDETTESCKNIPCPSYAFRCQYGACVDADAKCNKKQECADRSDEKGCPGETSGETSTPINQDCKKNQFVCKSGFCLDPFLLCDGTKDCDDGSDETREVCGTFRCPQYTFQCKYGACIEQDGKCNGIPQCADGSDETEQLCGKSTTTTTTPAPPPSSSGDCILPEQPANGYYHIGGCDKSCPFKAGSKVKTGSIIRYTCQPGFKLSGSDILLCDPEWSSFFPTCAKVVCPALSLPSRDIECELDGKKVECGKPMAPGTKALVRCNTQYFHDPEFSQFDTFCQENGEWTRPVIPCTPKCGLVNAKGLPFVANGVEAKRGEFPWHVGIYQIKSDGKLEQICGGSIVSPRAIVTAAHCFWNPATSEPADIKNYKVILGKHYRDWDVRSEPDYTQVPEISRVEIPERFKGEVRNYAHDIAVIVLNVEIQMSVVVRPICVDFQKIHTYLFTPGKSGTVVGWGYTENNTQSEVLHTAVLPHIGFEVCEKEVPQSFYPFLTFDKFCAGYRNGTSVCSGDSGGGYATEFRDGKWYLMGIVSVGVPSTSFECNIYQYTTFTRVPEYYDFIKRFI